MTLSEMCDTTSNYIGQIEMGRRIPSFEKIEKIASALKIPSYEMFTCETGENQEKLLTKDYLQKMPANVKKEVILKLLSLIKADIIESLDTKNY